MVYATVLHTASRFCKIQLPVITSNFDSFIWQIYKQILISQFYLCLFIRIQQQQFQYLMFDLYIYAVLAVTITHNYA